MTMNIAIKYAKLPHGLTYFYQHWMPDSPKALIVFVHGLGDHIGRYNEAVARFTRRGFACALYDARGHGRTGGRRGHVEHFIDWVNDLASFTHFSQMSVPRDTPVFIIGSSLGALVGLNFLLTHTVEVKGMIALSAAIKPTVQIPNWKKKLARRFAKFVPTFSINNGVKLADLTKDEAELLELQDDTLFHQRMTLKTAAEIERNLELAMAMPHRIHTPMLMLAGDADAVCDPDGTRQFALRLSSTDKQYKVYPGMLHDLLHDNGREIIFEHMENWITQRIMAGAEIDKQFGLQRRESLWENVSPPSP